MPNWIEGSLKIRGQYDNVKRFFSDGINVYRNELIGENYYELVEPRETWLIMEESGEKGERELYLNIKDARWVYVEGTKRAFITSEFIQARERTDGETVVCCNIQQAWCFRERDWVNISNQYGVDIKLHGFESGMEFEQYVEVIDGVCKYNRETKYNDWEWDCPFPRLGG